MGRFISLFLIPFVFSNSANALQFSNAGKKINERSLKALKSKIKEHKITVYEPHEDKKVTYKAFKFNEVMDQVYGKTWRKTEEVLFTCSDGYQPSIPGSLFKKYSAYLAFAKVGSKKFELVNRSQNNERVHVGPFYLVWDNLKNAAARREGDSIWPYQVVKVDLVRFKDRFPKLAPPNGSSAKVKRGFLLYRKECMVCHTLNGEGGKKASELNSPVSVTKRMPEKKLIQWIDEPTKIDLKTKMPALEPEIKNRKGAISDIVAYLKAMAK